MGNRLLNSKERSRKKAAILFAYHPLLAAFRLLLSAFYPHLLPSSECLNVDISMAAVAGLNFCCSVSWEDIA